MIVWHIGGGDDDVGPIARVCNEFPGYKIVTFEALDGTCVDEGIGEADFYVNKHPLSSGLLPPNPRFACEMHTGDITWGENTELQRMERVKTTNLDTMRTDYPQPDVLSIDCQGAELRIMRGGRSIMSNLLCVVAEVEFEPIYEGQDLFDGQMGFLRPYGFRLMELYGAQSWHPGPKFGLGFVTVAEAVWLRFDYENLRREQVETLAKIAFGFGRLSYGLRLLEHIGGQVEDPKLAAFWQHRDNPELRSVG